MAAAYCRLLELPDLDKEIFCLAAQHQPLCWAVACAARAAGFTGAVERGPAVMEDESALFNQNIFLNSDKAHRVLGWALRQPGILADIDRCYQGWKAGQEQVGVGQA